MKKSVKDEIKGKFHEVKGKGKRGSCPKSVISARRVAAGEHSSDRWLR